MMLPQELLDTIVDEVTASEDATADAQSSLLGSTVGPECVRALSRTIKGSSHLAPYIVELTIDFNIGERGSRPGYPGQRHLTSALRTCSIPPIPPSPFVCQWRILSPARPPQRGIPSSLIIHALSSYKEVALASGVEIHTDEGFIPIPTPSLPPILRTLDLYCFPRGSPMSEVLNLILSPERAEYTAHVRHLKLSMDLYCRSLGPYKDLPCIRNLQHLELRFLGPSPGSGIALPDLPHLRRLTLHAPVRELKVPAALITTLADLGAHTPSLEAIAVVLRLTASIDVYFENYVDATSATPAPNTDATLVELPHLRAATFSIDAAPGAQALFTRSMEAKLPRAHAGGRLALEGRMRLDKCLSKRKGAPPLLPWR
ncbi:hypothetical protein FB451DRAFT_1452836 [Mycena latifolia]|nr:hypothetical protein FB451DRAFT_1452836 [Mycena latifolia]